MIIIKNLMILKCFCNYRKGIAVIRYKSYYKKNDIKNCSNLHADTIRTI